MTEHNDGRVGECGGGRGEAVRGTVGTETIVDDLSACASVLAGLFLTDPVREGLPLMQALAAEGALDTWPFGGAEEREGIREALGCGLVSEGEVRRAWRRLFVCSEHFEAPPWGSVYLDPDEALFGSSELELRQWLRAVGVEWSRPGGRREPVDHIGRLWELLALLATERPEAVRPFLEEHLMPWAPRYFDLLEEAGAGTPYAGVAQLARVTLQGVATQVGAQAAFRKLFH